MTHSFHGIHTALVTPFGEDGRVDVSAFEALVQRQLDAGIHGLVPCGTTGETPTLTREEQDELIAIAVRLADGKVPVTAGIGTNNTVTTIERAEQVKALGVDAGLMTFPYYNKPNRTGHIAHVKAVAATGLPLVLYHVPGRTGQRLDADFVAELCNIEGVVAVKEATGDVAFGTQVMLGTSVPVLSGDDFTFLGLVAQGGAGCISVVSNVDPVRTVAIYEHYRAARIGEAIKEFQALFPLVSYLFSESNPVPAKAAMSQMGLCRADCRLPLGFMQAPECGDILTSLGLA